MLRETRLLKPGDEGMLIDAAALYNEVDISRDAAAALLANPAFLMLAALNDRREIMGRIYGYILPRFDQTDLFLYEVDVSERYQREGVGQAMMERLKTLCRERNYGEMFVLTECDNEGGNALYTKSGSVLEGSPANVHVFFTPDK
jgi:ribosomal protein S18 acetylase RimI-like enzyme